jgi:hypothetical protein
MYPTIKIKRCFDWSFKENQLSELMYENKIRQVTEYASLYHTMKNKNKNSLKSIS